MANYKLVFRKSVSKDLRSIPNKDVARILQRLEWLQENPRPADSEKLSGQERYRIRQGVYRVVYEVQDELLVVTVVKVGHRKHVYKRR
ncbi:type II toxin-antitoxin system RelE family toxin [Wenzhouxiangella limi]|uniref:Type II toxin-antitoxin system RelE/ParE family toxin n=1 Tax=Wenzhouxiangella limi TaxID=2707351 RepID=A0A845V0E1_9GAMM|nr:type II toxin-antitoxin system RelE/ParE family toxin [Wenzhouxiangella limi]NDY96194.1 type II toxin-antitoxin system RelE/ParE family toxin [Wenzhouxiangella limi]